MSGVGRDPRPIRAARAAASIAGTAGLTLFMYASAPAQTAPVIRVAPLAPAILHAARAAGAPQAVAPLPSARVGPAQTAIGAPAAAPVPIVLPYPGALTNSTTVQLLGALLAIDQAQHVDPQAAQRASFQYVKALQQYRSGDISGANRTALQALSTAGTAQVKPVIPAVPAPALAAAPVQAQGTAGGLYGADAPAIDADSFIALARGMLDDCAARHDRRLSAAQAHFAAAERDFAAGEWEATRLDAKAAIDACAKAQP